MGRRPVAVVIWVGGQRHLSAGLPPGKRPGTYIGTMEVKLGMAGFNQMLR
jgi:hypothetical protein